MNVDKTIAGLHPLERKVLPVLDEVHEISAVAKKTALQEVEVMRAFQWLQNKKLVRLDKKLQEEIHLDANGEKYAKEGLPEVRFLNAIEDGIAADDAQKKAGIAKEEMGICLGLLKRLQLIEVKKDGGLVISLTKKGREAQGQETVDQQFLNKKFPISSNELSKVELQVLEGLKRRKQIVKVKIIKHITAEPTVEGKKIIDHGISDKGVVDHISPQLLRDGSWKGKELRRFDVDINVPAIYGGKQHFVNQAVDYIKRIWLDLGFKEMTGNYVQTAFWDLDALFVPQDHPAREMQDTFYIKDPKTGKLPSKFHAAVKAMHEHGGDINSTGWKTKYSDAVAKENLLRTHTTVLSAQTISQLKKEDLPAKFFSVGKVFRNEALSWKHLFEFIQVEGIVIDPNANFRNLQGYLKEFFRKMGFSDVRIRPGHFPYVEPGAEIDVFHPTRKQWVELGGSGIFRPEVVKPLLGFECPVLAWGIGLERSIIDYYKFSDVRDIYKNDLKDLKEIKLWMK